MFKKLISILLSVIMIFGVFTISFATDSDSGIIRFGADGKFKIMHVTDTHLEDFNVDDTVWALGKACDEENPDIVIITGDIAINNGDEAETKRIIGMLMNVFEQRDIPVAVTFGNHDSEVEGAMTREEVMACYNSYSCSVSVDDGEALSGCGTYNIPVLASDSDDVKFNIWVFDSGDYDDNGHYGCVMPDQIEWYKQTSDALAAANGGEKVNSVVFQHIIVPEIYDVLEKVNYPTLFAFPRIYSENEYYRFDPDNVNYGTLNEKPCPGYENYGQFDAMVEKGDVLAMFTGHDHTNAFGVRNQGIDITTTISSRYNGESFSSAYGYRIVEIDENDTSTYYTRVVRWYDFFTMEDVIDCIKNGNKEDLGLTFEIAFGGFWHSIAKSLYRFLGSVLTFRQVSYPD